MGRVSLITRQEVEDLNWKHEIEVQMEEFMNLTWQEKTERASKRLDEKINAFLKVMGIKKTIQEVIAEEKCNSSMPCAPINSQDGHDFLESSSLGGLSKVEENVDRVLDKSTLIEERVPVENESGSVDDKEDENQNGYDENGTEESDSSGDKVAPRNTIGNVLFECYKEEEHIGYDISGKKIKKKDMDDGSVRENVPDQHEVTSHKGENRVKRVFEALDKRRKSLVLDREVERKIKDLYEKYKNHENCYHLIANAIEEDRPKVSPHQVSRTLKKLGFKLRRKGSHKPWAEIVTGFKGGTLIANYKLMVVDDLSEMNSKVQSTTRHSLVGVMRVLSQKGILLCGPPGVGKTLLVKVVAGEAGVNFFSISVSQFVEIYVGVGASCVRELYQEAKENVPSVVFIDELDAVGREHGLIKGSGGQERDATLSQLLVCLDGFQDREEVITIASTNRLDILDPALVRLGRIEILKVHARKKPMSPDVDYMVVVSMTDRMVGAVVEVAAINMIRDGRTENFSLDGKTQHSSNNNFFNSSLGDKTDFFEGHLSGIQVDS